MSDTTKTPVTADAAAFAAARPTAAEILTSPKLLHDQPAGKKGVDKKSIPALTSFDLLEGEYLKNRKNRMVSLVSLGAAGLLFVLISAQLVRVRFEIASEVSRNDKAISESVAARAALDQLPQFEGVPGNIVEDVLRGRAAHAASATESEIDLVQVVQEITSLAPQGVVITSITLGPAAKTVGEGADSSYALVTVLATAQSYPAITPFLEKMRASENLNNFKESWSGAPPDLRLSITITLRTASSKRYVQFATDAGIIDVELDGAGS